MQFVLRAANGALRAVTLVDLELHACRDSSVKEALEPPAGGNLAEDVSCQQVQIPGVLPLDLPDVRLIRRRT